MEDIKNTEKIEEDMTDAEIAVEDLVNELLFEIDTDGVPVDTFWSNISEKLRKINMSYNCVIDIDNELSYIIINDSILKIISSTYEDDDDTYGSFEIEESSNEEVLSKIDEKLTNLHSEIDKFDSIKKMLTSN